MEKEITAEEKQHQLRVAFQKKIAFLLSKKVLHENEVRDLVRDLFKEWLGLNFEFTYEEAGEALDSIYVPDLVREKLHALLEDMNLTEFYQDHEPTEEDLQHTIRRVQGLLPEMLGENKVEKDIIGKILATLRLPGFRQGKIPLPAAQGAAAQITSMPSSFPNTPLEESRGPAAAVAMEQTPEHAVEQAAQAWLDTQTQQAQVVRREPPDAANALMIEDTSETHQRIYERLERLYAALDAQDSDGARRIYNDILTFYHPLPPEDKQAYYDVLYQVYQKLSSS